MVKDLFSRRIVGWAVDDSLETTLLEATLLEATLLEATLLEATLVATAWQRAMETRGFGAGEGSEL